MSDTTDDLEMWVDDEYFEPKTNSKGQLIWKQKNGKETTFYELETDHLINIKKMLERGNHHWKEDWIEEIDRVLEFRNAQS